RPLGVITIVSPSRALTLPAVPITSPSETIRRAQSTTAARSSSRTSGAASSGAGPPAGGPLGADALAGGAPGAGLLGGGPLGRDALGAGPPDGSPPAVAPLICLLCRSSALAS